jgi:flagellar L-ring protein precursor FlgH
MRTIYLAVTAAWGLVACGPAHVAPFVPRQRVYTAGNYALKDAAARPGRGSLFSEATPGFLEDTRAHRVGDTIVIRIEENADAAGGSNTTLQRDSSGTSGVTAMLGILPALKRAYPGMDPQKLFEFGAKSAFSGDGATTRRGQLTGSLAVRVVKELPNGDLYLEGTKVVLINNEEQHLYVSGLARTADIGPDNSMSSSRVADAQIEFTGRGDVADQQRRGWAARALDAINPF